MRYKKEPIQLDTPIEEVIDLITEDNLMLVFRLLKVRYGLKYTDIAILCGVSKSSIYSLNQGIEVFTYDNMQLLIYKLKVGLHYLIRSGVIE
jgi:hypothetical protein